MNETEIRRLIEREEGANLDFKRKWYELESEDSRMAKSQKGEMVKDILSLANGNTNVAGEISYLVIGVSDEKDEQGNRELFDVHSDKPVTRQRILSIVNGYCDPAIEDLLVDEIFLDEKKILVISVLPSPHVHETIKELKTSKSKFDSYTVFVRYGADIRTASTKERMALKELKVIRYKQTKNVSPITFGAALGAFIFYGVAPKLLKGDSDTAKQIRSKQAGGALAGALLGGSIGMNVVQIKEFSLIWKQSSKEGKIKGAFAAPVIAALLWIASKLFRPKESKETSP